MKGSGNSSMYMLPGMQVKISLPFDVDKGVGWVASTGTFVYEGEKYELVKGFFNRDDTETIGTIEATSEDGLSIIYKHKKPERNEIGFVTSTQLVSIISIISVPIHDHSSIVQGGPAYGTFFTDDTTK